MSEYKRANNVEEQRKTRALALRSALQHPNNVKMFRDLVPQTLSSTLTPERICMLMMMSATRTPQLLECEPVSLIKSACDLLGLGIDPSGITGEGYLLPFRKQGAMTAVPVVGYKGYISLARRSGMVQDIVCNLVYERDTFDMELSTMQVTHKLDIRSKDRGACLGGYALATFNGGGRSLEWMSVDEINAIRDGSNAYRNALKWNKTDTPWITHWPKMARKTIIRSASAYWPKCVELSQAYAIEDNADRVYEATLTPTTPAQIDAEISAPDAEFVQFAQEFDAEMSHDPETGEVSGGAASLAEEIRRTESARQNA